MYLIGGILFAIVGVIMTVRPQWIFSLAEMWKNDSATEPSDLYLISTRVGGVFFILIGIGAIIFLG